MIISSDKTKFKEVSFEGDNLKIFRGEVIPDGLLRANKIQRDNGEFNWMDREKEWHHVARIPKIVMDRLYIEHPEEMRDPESKFLYKWLDREENKIWKTFAGRLA